ncbi:glycosyltransferase [Solirhodobacter olei]|uniref:glycosyltransferase n=1 Tax=Solirhodobacter olei TaxID=2493082 RepID=UPI000FDBC89A|nr:glycosyltransferase [Solirhodobacter olei]
MKVVVIGPVAPFRGGIARHTTAVARELASRPDTDVSIISFSRQYPKLLYPGKTDRDLGAKPASGIATSFCLDTVNPLSWLRAARKALHEKPDIAVVPAWTFFVAPALAFVSRALRRRHIPVVTIVHNADDHEAARWKALISDLQLRQSSRCVTHNVTLAQELRRRFPGLPVTVSPHPRYDDYPLPSGTLKRRADLELLFFGLVRPYKGLDILLHAMARMETKDVFLSVVGEFWSGRDETESIIAELELTDRVEVVPRYVSDEEAAEYFDRCDAVVAPYRSASASGVLALAQNYLRPVVASDIPALAEAVEPGGTGWLFPSEDPAALAELLDGLVDQRAREMLGPQLAAHRERLSWSIFADAVLDASGGDI